MIEVPGWISCEAAGWKEAYNPIDEVIDKKKPLYRSKEAEFLVLSGCYGDSNFNIAIEACWQK